MSIEPFVVAYSTKYSFDIYSHPYNQFVTEISKFLILAYSISSNEFNWLHILNKICLTEEFNSSLLNKWNFRFGYPYEIVIIPVEHLEHIYELQTFSRVYEIFYRQIYSENSMFFWLTDNFTNETSSQQAIYFELALLPPVAVGAPSLNFIANSMTNVSKGTILTWIEIPKLFKKMFWNCNGRIIHGVVLVRLDTPAYFAKYLNDTFACFKFIASRSNNTVYCSSGLMTSLHISNVHNFTLNIRDRTHPEQFTSFWGNGSNVEYFLTRNIGPSDPIQLPNDETRTKMFSSAHDVYPVYCNRNVLRKEPNSNTLVWTAGFTPELWLQIIVGFFALSFLYIKRMQITKRLGIKKIENMLLIFVSSLTLQPTFKNNKINGRLVALAIIWLGLFIDIMYGNSIVSVITVPAQPKILNSLPEALYLGYKFIWNPGYYFGATYESFFRSEFKLLGVYHLINDSSIPGDWPLFYTKRFVDEKLMFGLYDVNLIPHTKLFLRGAESALGKKGSAICYTIPDSVHKSFTIWEMRVSSRRWLLLSAARIGESGLLDKWDEWANLAFLQNIEEDKEDVESKDELNKESAVDFDKFLAPCELFVMLSVISSIIFFSRSHNVII